MTLKEKLMHIQAELKAPKNLLNKFGGYNYRNAESILEALKPLQTKYNVSTTLQDDIIQIGDRIYVKTIATIFDCESDDKESVVAYAREADAKKGMDDAQVTGATSSYARKYALNGLFLLDDTKDADSEEYQAQANREAKKPTPKQQTKAPEVKADDPRAALRKFIKDNGLDPNAIVQTCGLNKNSTDKDYAEALMYAKSLVQA